MSESVGGRIRRARQLSKLSARELAPKIGLKPNSLYLVERGKRGISFTKLKRIAQVLKVPVATLLDLASTSGDS